MKTKDFEKVVEDQIQRCRDILIVKAKEYADMEGDRLHNFKVAAVLQNCSPIRAAAGMLAKHTVSIYDMCISDGAYSMEMWNEKITDHMNYLLLLKALIVEDLPYVQLSEVQTFSMELDPKTIRRIDFDTFGNVVDAE